MLETVFLDAGGVLMFPNWTRIAEALARHGVSVTPEALAAAEPLAKRDLDVTKTIQVTNDVSRGWLYFNSILTTAGIPLSADTQAALDDLQIYHRAHNLWELVPPDVLPALTTLRAHGLALTIVSNANGTLCAHVARLGLAAHLDFVLDSCDLGVEKPDPRLFEAALERSRARRETTIHVGDLYEVDVVGARNAGIRGVLLDQAGLYEGIDCPRVRSLTELVGQIEDGIFD
ncbi:MAG: HAD family hydrolase [Acidobacteria bacterium]|nr:HAD family hydrolase [Acidobacteriota bacterium]